MTTGRTRRHIIAHVHRNAEALRRLTHGAETGERISHVRRSDQLHAALARDVAGKRSANGEAAALAEWPTGRTTVAPVLGAWL